MPQPVDAAPASVRTHSGRLITPPPQRGVLDDASASLNPKTTVDDGIEIIFRAALARWLGAVPAAIRSNNVEGIHKLRVALRRLRSALSLLKTYIPPHQRSELDAEFKWLVDALAPARDLDVFYHDLLVPLQRAQTVKGADALIEAISQQRAMAERKAHIALVSIRHRKLVDAVSTWVEIRRWHGGRLARAPLAEPVGRVARKLLNTRLRKVLKQGRGIKKLSSEDLHELRISVKKLRYGISFFQGALPNRVRKLSKKLAALQDSLGRLNDAAVATELVARLAKGARTAKARDNIRTAGKQLVAYHKKTAADVWPDITPQWKAIKQFGAL